jgi:hypothetical protein
MNIFLNFQDGFFTVKGLKQTPIFHLREKITRKSDTFFRRHQNFRYSRNIL